MIGNKLGEVLDVDVPNKGVQWGRCLRVRVKIDITKKLLKGKKITVENDEQCWVYFRYERLPNFYYICGKLGYGEKECQEGDQPSTDKKKEPHQYGSRLRGKPFKCPPKKDVSEFFSRPPEFKIHHSKKEGAKPLYKTRMVGVPHMTKQASDPTRPFATTLTHSEESHAPTDLEPGTKPAIEPAEGTIAKTKQKLGCARSKSGYSLDKNKSNASGVGSAHPMMMTDEEDADLPLRGLVNVQSLATFIDHTNGTMAMIYDKDLGWVDELIGPKTRYWNALIEKIILAHSKLLSLRTKSELG
nr:hypothetical protein CFP56_67312 [Quercus suber]